MYLAYALVVCNMMAFKSSQVVMTLFAIELGAGPLIIGVLVGMYAVLPMLLALSAGRLSDRFGVRMPMLCGSMGVCVGLVLPYLFPRLGTLYVSAAVLGGSYVFYHVSVQNMIGSASTAQTRTRNFSSYSLVLALASFAGPLATGFSIDHFGHARTYLYLALLPLTAVLILFAAASIVPATRASAREPRAGKVAELLSSRPLRRILITSGLVLTGIDLFNFYVPIYCHDIGMSATVIGTILSAFALAAVVVRLIMPRLVKRFGEEGVLAGALVLAAATYLLFPFFRDATLLALISFMLGLGLGCGQPLSMLLTYNRSPPGRSGEALGLRLTVNNLTHVLVPVAFGLIGSTLGLGPVFWSNAVLLAGGGYLMRPDSAGRNRPRSDPGAPG